MQETVSWDVQGEFVTQLARTFFYADRKPYEYVMQFLFGCLSGTDQSSEELTLIAHEILVGEKQLVGSTREGTYGLVDDDFDIDAEYPDFFENNDAIAVFEQHNIKLPQTEKQAWELVSQVNDIIKDATSDRLACIIHGFNTRFKDDTLRRKALREFCRSIMPLVERDEDFELTDD
jgi:hypothetical protein